MDKNAIKKYAVWARRELIARVSQRAALYDITEKNPGDPNAESVRGNVLTAAEKSQRQALIAQINQKGYQEVMEEVAYTWFNRFSALRFMEVNGYLPSHVRVFTDDENTFRPQILSEAINLEIAGVDMEKVYALKNANDNDELFKYLIIVQCNALSDILPGMFQRIADYTELLFPDNLLREGSAVEQMIAMIPEDDWRDAVQIIGWLYQFYIGEPKDDLINARKQYKEDDIPFVTQLFTSDWIVRFMVENALGRLWIEKHPNSAIFSSWSYYLNGLNGEKIEPKSDVVETFSGDPADIKCIDPCSGSGHILAYMFDVLLQMYEEYGYSTRDAVSSIVKNNLYGLDIDERAIQMTYFTVMMKARQYDRRFFSRGIQPHCYAIRNSQQVDDYTKEYFCGNDAQLRTDIEVIIEKMTNGRLLGSIIEIPSLDFARIYNRFAEISEDVSMYQNLALTQLLPLVKCAEVLSGKYDAVITNPPYMNSAYMPTKLKQYVVTYYPDFKSDLFAVFMNVVTRMCKDGGHLGLLMPYVWMFISSYEKMRLWVNRHASITSLVQLEYNAFEAACVPVAALTLKKTKHLTSGQYIKLSEFRGAENQAPRTLEAVADENCPYRFVASQTEFEQIPGCPYAFWMDKQFTKLFTTEKSIKKIARARSGAKTGNNEKFIKCWWEVDYTTFSAGTKDYSECENSEYRWFPHNKGGVYQNWYGNRELVINFYHGGSEIRENGTLTGASYDINARDVYFKEGITWTALTSSKTLLGIHRQGAFLTQTKVQ